MIRSPIDPSLRTVPDEPVVSDDGLVFRRVETLAEYHECVVIQEETWGLNFRERVPTAILMVGQKLSGVCAAAFTPDGRMLGFVFGITGPYRGELAHWSDLLAVRPESRGQHVGERLKHYQRQLCRNIGLETIYWTFDPLVARNAHLNLRRLGARASEYVVNMYGNNTGSPLHGALDTDRWVAAWDLTATPRSEVTNTAHTGIFALRASADGQTPLEQNSFPEAPRVRVAIPRDLDGLTLDVRKEWRDSTRRAFLHYLALGYNVTSFQRAASDQPPYYELAADATHR